MIRRRLWLQATLVFAFALLIKLVYVEERLKLPDVDHPILDSLFHDQWARGLAFHQWTPDLERLQHEPYFRAPLYPYFLSAIYRTFGTGPGAVFTMQAVLGALTVSLMFLFCARAFDARVAWIAALVQIGYWPFTYHEAERLVPAISIPLDMLLLFLLARAARTRQMRDAGLVGVAAGLAAIARPTILIAFPFGLAWLAMQVKPAAWKRAVVAAAMAALVIAPVTVRNLTRGHDRVIIASQGGVNFFIGNNPQSDGVKAVVPGTRADWWGGYDDTQRIAQEAAGRALKPSGISAYWYRRGLDFIKQQPAAAARLYWRKAILVVGNAEPSNERQLYFRRKGSHVLSWMHVGFALILASALAGLYFALRGKERSVALLCAVLATVYGLGIMAFFVNSRFRLPVALYLIPLSAFGLVALYDVGRARRWRELAPVGGIACVVFVASMANPYGIGAVADTRGYYSLGVDYYRKAEYDHALEALNRSLQVDSTYAPAWMMRGRTYGHLGNPNAAIQDLKRSCAIDSMSADALFWLGVAYQKAGRHAQAEAPYRRSLALDPDRAEAATNLADVFFRAHRPEDARVWLQRALSVDSTYANALYGLGYYYEIKGKYDEAEASYKRAIPFPPARIGLERLARNYGQNPEDAE